MNQEFDIAISGSGITGNALAVLLSKLMIVPSKIALIQKIDHSLDATNETNKPDVLALSYGSKLLLETIDAWPKESSIIKTVHISKFNQFGELLLKNTDLHIDELGSIVHYKNLQKTLASLAIKSGVSLIHGNNIEIVRENNSYQIMIDGSLLNSTIVVQANGVNDNEIKKQYNQKALLTTIQVKSNHNNRWAWERFTDTGCIALLPTPQNLDMYSVIWCDNTKNIECLINMTNKEFSKLIKKFFEKMLGNMSADFERHTIPLSLKIKKHLTDLNLVAIGNAAQTIHPIGGQGLNLGLRDVGCLARCIDKWLDNKTETINILRDFDKQRSADRLITIGMTDMLANILSSKINLIQKTFGMSLSIIDAIKPLKKSIIKQLILGLKI